MVLTNFFPTETTMGLSLYENMETPFYKKTNFMLLNVKMHN